MSQVTTSKPRLIVAADSPEDTPSAARRQTLHLAEQLDGLGIYFKVESVLRLLGYSLIPEIAKCGIRRIMADLKLSGTPETLEAEGKRLSKFEPAIVTTYCATGVTSMKALKAQLPNTEVFGVTVLASFDQRETMVTLGCGYHDAALHLAGLAYQAGLDGVVCAPTEAVILRNRFKRSLSGGSFTINADNIRPEGLPVVGDDRHRSRSMTPSNAFQAGVSGFIVGRPITQASNPRDAAERILEELSRMHALV